MYKIFLIAVLCTVSIFGAPASDNSPTSTTIDGRGPPIPTTYSKPIYPINPDVISDPRPEEKAPVKIEQPFPLIEKDQKKVLKREMQTEETKQPKDKDHDHNKETIVKRQSQTTIAPPVVLSKNEKDNNQNKHPATLFGHDMDRPKREKAPTENKDESKKDTTADSKEKKSCNCKDM